MGSNLTLCLTSPAIVFRPSVRISILLLCLVMPVLAIHGQTLDETSLPRQIALVTDGHQLPVSSFGMMVREVGNPVPALQVNAGTAFNPASAMKVITTLTALEKLGPAFTWDTEVFALGPIRNGTLHGDLLIQGGGDPFLVEEDFRALLKNLQRRGVRRIEGDLILDGAYFDTSVSMQDILDNDASRAYNVRPNAVISNFQAVTFYFSPDPTTEQVLVNADPPLPNLVIYNQLRQRNGSCSGYQRGISFSENPEQRGSVTLSGRFPSGCNEYRMIRSVLDPATYTFGLFQLLWKELGGEFSGELRQEAAPLDQDPLYTWSSRPLSDIIQSINKASNNMMARQLLLTLGAEALEAPATVEKGEAIILEFLQQQGITTEGFSIENGAGLSRTARVSPDTMAQVLDFAYRQPLGPEFLSSLPIAGTDGTMRNRLRGTQAGSIRVKTGSLNEVAAVAGYVRGRSGKMYVVSGMVNHELADRGPGRELLDAMLQWASTL